jgi:Rhodopirellula transposase DDE domain
MLKYSREIEETMKIFYETLSEKDRRRYGAIEALKLGHGGQKYICEVLDCDAGTVKRGSEELQNGEVNPEDRIRKAGGGGKKIIEKIENIDEVFLEIVKDDTAGSPMDEAIKWTNLGQRAVSKAFEERGYKVSEYVVKQLLKKHKYVKRKMQKTKTVKEAKQRNEQFENIKELREKYTQNDNPIMSIDVKKRDEGELLSGRERVLHSGSPSKRP